MRLALSHQTFSTLLSPIVTIEAVCDESVTFNAGISGAMFKRQKCAMFKQLPKLYEADVVSAAETYLQDMHTSPFCIKRRSSPVVRVP